MSGEEDHRYASLLIQESTCCTSFKRRSKGAVTKVQQSRVQPKRHQYGAYSPGSPDLKLRRIWGLLRGRVWIPRVLGIVSASTPLRGNEVTSAESEMGCVPEATGSWLAFLCFSRLTPYYGLTIISRGFLDENARAPPQLLQSPSQRPSGLSAQLQELFSVEGERNGSSDQTGSFVPPSCSTDGDGSVGKAPSEIAGGTLANPALGRLKQGHWCESEASPGYKVKHCLKDQSQT